MTSRWRPDPLTLVALAASAVGAVILYDKSGDFVVSGDRLVLYSAIPLAPVAILLIVAMVRSEPSAVRRFALPLALGGLVGCLIHGLYAWGVMSSPTLCGASSGCSDGLGSGFLDLSWFSWLTIAAYFATVAAAFTLEAPRSARVAAAPPG